jgi:RNA polymerase sigma factor (sigma-70 family)
VSGWHVFRIEEHQRLVRFFVRQFHWATHSGRICDEDLVQEGNLGLLHACAKFDPSLGWMFSTYARRWVQNYMQRFIESRSFPVSYPTNFTWRQPKDGIQRKGGVSLDAPSRRFGHGEASPMKDFLKSKAQGQERDLFDAETRSEAHLMVMAILPVIGARNTEILLRRANGETLEAIGADTGVTRERVRQIYNDALEKCRRLPQAKRAKQLLESA